MRNFLAGIVVVWSCVSSCVALDNGLAMTPPMGWRSWNQFQCNGYGGVALSQQLLIDTINVMTDRSRGVSLRDVGYVRVGLDDCWQLCGGGANGDWHDKNGYPVVNTTRFPDFVDFTSYAHSHDMYADWYLNNCHCRSNCSSDACFTGDTAAAISYGFDGVKLDGCSAQKDIDRWAALFNATGRPMLIENCHNGPNFPDPSKTPLEQSFHYFRSSGDIRPTHASTMSNLQSVRDYVTLTGPGSWSYPDMLEVGVTNTQRPNVAPLTLTQAQTHFGAWCVVSSPLILGFDVTNKTALDLVWPIITNTEAIAVNQAWAGHPGDVVDESELLIHYNDCDWNDRQCALPAWQVWAKPTATLASGAVSHVAVFLVNNDRVAGTVTVDFSSLDGNVACGTQGCNVRDIWSHKDLGAMTSFSKNLQPAESAFILVSIPSGTSTSQGFNIHFAPPPPIRARSSLWEPTYD